MIVDNLNQDIRLAARGLWRARSFTAVAVLMLALGIAGTTVMFTLIQGVLLRPLPVHEQDRLIIAWKEVRSSGSAHYPFGNTEIESVAEASQLLEKAAGVTRNGVGRSVVVDNGVSSYANVALVTGGFFDVLGVRPMLGRTLTPADEKDGEENVIVISSGLWQRRLLTDFELMILLAVLRVGEEAYGVPIAREIEATTGRRVLLGAAYAALERLERNGLVFSSIGSATPERGGRAKRFFRVTQRGLRAIRETQQALTAMWRDVAQLKEKLI